MITKQRFLMIKVVWVDMFNYVRIFLITFLSLNVLLVCEDTINAPLNKLEAETQKAKYLKGHRSKILANRPEEMEKHFFEKDNSNTNRKTKKYKRKKNRTTRKRTK